MTPAPPHAHHPIRDSVEHPEQYGLRQWSGWVIGPVLLLVTLLFSPPEGLSVEGWRTIGVAALMATFWITESVPIPIAALLPLVLLPALHLGEIGAVAAPYANPIIYLFLGGFLLALALQRWNLHRRVALVLIARLGTSPARIVGGFLLSSALVSMWVSNTATALMMLPIGLSVVEFLPEKARGSAHGKAFSAALMLAIAYGATTGGMATLIGTPPNALLAAYVEDIYGFQIGFGQWMLIGVPITLATLPLVWFVLTRVVFKLDRVPVPGMKELIEAEKAALGPLTWPEMAVATVFSLTALGWIFQPLLKGWLPMLTDTTIAMTGGLLLFAVPANVRKGVFLMDWKSTKALPWDVLILFGGGLSLANAIQSHGVATYLGGFASGASGLPVFVLIAAVSLGILFLTELTSNTATAATFLPIVGALAVSMGHNPLLLLIPTALAANCSYMMPVGTPPNAIVFGSGRVGLPQMATAGLILNFALVPVFLFFLWLLGGPVFGIVPGTLPSWAH